MDLYRNDQSRELTMGWSQPLIPCGTVWLLAREPELPAAVVLRVSARSKWGAWRSVWSQLLAASMLLCASTALTTTVVAMPSHSTFAFIEMAPLSLSRPLLVIRLQRYLGRSTAI